MAKSSEVRERMISAGEHLLRRRGYGPTTMLDVIERAETPRGSIYYHFPNGKEELALEVMSKVAGELDELVRVMAEKHESTEDFLKALVRHHAKRLSRSDFSEGCPVAGVALAMDTESIPLQKAADETFDIWTSAIKRELITKGLSAVDADRVARHLVAGVEGALVLGRATRSPKAFAVLEESALALLRARQP